MKRRLTRILKQPSDASLPLIIRSIDDEMYPDVDANPLMGRMSSWVHLEFHGIYHNGIELSLRTRRIVYVIIERSSIHGGKVDGRLLTSVRRTSNGSGTAKVTKATAIDSMIALMR